MGNLATVMSKFLLLSAHFLRKDTHPLHQKTQNKKRNLCHDLCIKNIQMQAGSIHAQKYIIKNQNCSCQSRIFNGYIRRWFLMENYFCIDQIIVSSAD